MVLEVPLHGACPFCDYLSGLRPYTILWRDPKVAVLVTREQRGLSHLLVLPQDHYATLLDLPDSSAEELMVALRDAASTVVRSGDVKGVAVWQNNGVSAHQSIAHLHFHVAGTLPNGGTAFGSVPEVPVSETGLIACKLGPFVPSRPGRIVTES